MKLDRNKPFGTVYGPAAHAFEQDGKLFDNDENEICAEPVKNKGGRPPKAKEEDPQLSAQLKD